MTLIIRFGVSNFRSIRDYQEFSLVASSLKDDGTDLIGYPSLKEKLLPSVLLYGANASGKSNLLGAIDFFRDAILISYRGLSPNSNIPIRTFRLDEKFVSEPSTFDCDFIISGVRYHYGFKCNREKFLEEWLYVFPQGNRQAWFRREGQNFKIGKYLKGKISLVEEITRDNCLFLSAAAQVSNEQLSVIYNYFADKFIFILNDVVSSFNINKAWSSSGLDKRVINFLRFADTGINSHKVNESPASERTTDLIEKLSKVFKDEFPDDAGDFDLQRNSENKELLLGHRTSAGADVFFDLSFESRGTLRLLQILKPIFDALDRGAIVIVDEIDASLHTLLAKQIVSLFSSKVTNRLGAQFIATTHDTNLLRSVEFRRDQIWFTEKDTFGATHIYPLTDFETRNTDNLEKGYLQGRYGAIPFISSEIGDFFVKANHDTDA